MKQQFRKICTQTAIWYSLLVFVYSFVTMILNLRSEGGPGASAERILLFLPFSILFSLANLILSGEKADPIVRWALHCALTVGGGFLCVILPLGGKEFRLRLGSETRVCNLGDPDSGLPADIAALIEAVLTRYPYLL